MSSVRRSGRKGIVHPKLCLCDYPCNVRGRKGRNQRDESQDARNERTGKYLSDIPESHDQQTGQRKTHPQPTRNMQRSPNF